MVRKLAESPAEHVVLRFAAEGHGSFHVLFKRARPFWLDDPNNFFLFELHKSQIFCRQRKRGLYPKAICLGRANGSPSLRNLREFDSSYVQKVGREANTGWPMAPSTFRKWFLPSKKPRLVQLAQPSGRV